jgi:hypothetical protein
MRPDPVRFRPLRRAAARPTRRLAVALGAAWPVAMALGLGMPGDDARAQAGAWPTKPVKLVVGFPPGSSSPRRPGRA